MPKKKVQDEKNSDDEDGSDHTQPNRASTPKKQGLNYTAICIMMLFILPSIFAIVLQLIDFMYPEAAVERRIRDRVTRCYEVANPTKLSDVDRFIKKYKGKEHALFAQLRTKYEKYPECQ